MMNGSYMRHLSCWGIYREREYSPEREFDDAEILRLTARHLEARGFRVELRQPDELAAVTGPLPPFMFLMCQRKATLERLRQYRRPGGLLINSPSSILKTYRSTMLGLLRRAGVPIPRTATVSTRQPTGSAEKLRWPGPCWVKRADVHKTQRGDVVFAPHRDGVPETLGNLAGRGLPRAVIQEHVEGDLIKFYGVGHSSSHAGRPPWFLWFYHKDQKLAGHPFDPLVLARWARRAARALGLDIFGGDAIAGGNGKLVLIDLNAWPSFALYRDEASLEIASYLSARFVKVVPEVSAGSRFSLAGAADTL